MSEAGFVTPPFDDLAACVNDVTRPAAARTRAIFYLRTIGTEEAAEVLRQGDIPVCVWFATQNHLVVGVLVLRSAAEQGFFTVVSS